MNSSALAKNPNREIRSTKQAVLNLRLNFVVYLHPVKVIKTFYQTRMATCMDDDNKGQHGKEQYQLLPSSQKFSKAFLPSPYIPYAETIVVHVTMSFVFIRLNT